MKIEELGQIRVKAGWVDGNLTASEAYAHLQAKKKTGMNQPALNRPVSLALIARTLNYGREAGETLGGTRYPAIPARPFMDLAERNFRKKLPRMMKAWLPALLSGKMTRREFEERLGSYMVGEIRTAMTEGQWAPLSAYTLKNRRHGGSRPLVDTGTLRASVSYEAE